MSQHLSSFLDASRNKPEDKDDSRESYDDKRSRQKHLIPHSLDIADPCLRLPGRLPVRHARPVKQTHGMPHQQRSSDGLHRMGYSKQMGLFVYWGLRAGQLEVILHPARGRVTWWWWYTGLLFICSHVTCHRWNNKEHVIVAWASAHGGITLLVTHSFYVNVTKIIAHNAILILLGFISF